MVDLDLVKFDRLDPHHPKIGLDAGGPWHWLAMSFGRVCRLKNHGDNKSR
jgi:hypothetical protein